MGFPETFVWGTATASYQVEGGAHLDGRGGSIWDTFCRTPGKVFQGHTGDFASDQYHRYEEDARLMSELGVSAYRFSIAWPRIYPEGAGRINQPGLDYYDRLIDALLDRDIEPAVTLYHWDLPQKLEDAGGWPARETADHFAGYAKTCFDAFGDRVNRWITLNEPWCTAYLGYQIGRHAPGRTDPADAVRAVHHLLLGHGRAVEAFRDGGYAGEIGITLNLQTPRPATRAPEDVEAADRAADRDSRMFTGPLFGSGYPERHLSAYEGLEVPIVEGDMEMIGRPIDFLGVNYYFEGAIRADTDHPEGFAHAPTWQPKTEMGWDIVPEGLLRHLRWIRRECGELPLYITENGCAVADELSDDGNRCHDPDRVAYLSKHFSVCRRAIEEGIDLRGYFLWSFVDNFEWAFGYSKRFGIVYCDYLDGRRVPKDSYYYYRDVIAGYEPVQDGLR